MDMFNKQLARIQHQLSGLTASQKMLTGALVAIMVMTLLYWGRHAGTAEMEPLLDQAFAQKDIPGIVAKLKGGGIVAKVEGDRVLVPADQTMDAVATLAYERLLPDDSQAGFQQMVAKLSPWASASERDAMYNHVKESTCARIISLFPDVQAAEVIIDPTRKRQLGGNTEPSAMVTITMREGGSGAAKQVAQAAVSVVAGAQAGLPPARINVVVNGRAQRTGAADDGVALGDEQLDLIRKHHDFQISNIMSLLDYMGDVRVVVSVKLDNSREELEEQKYDPKNSVSKPRSTEEEETDSRDGMPVAEEPGVNPNVVANQGMDITPAGGGTAMTKKRERTEFENGLGFSRSVKRIGPGQPIVASASVRLPRSYFAGALKRRTPGGAEPTDDAVDQYADAEIIKAKADVRGAAGMTADAPVSVALFDDVAVPALTVPETATTSVPMMLGKHSKEIALTGLALVSLFMVSMMVKKSAPAPALVAAAAAAAAAGGGGGVAGTPQLGTGEAVAGEAGSGNTLLDGMELDEESVRTQQMLDQVSTLVADNPDAAATLVKRWLNRD